MTKQDISSILCEFIAVELVPSIKDPWTRWNTSGLCAVLPFVLNEYLPDPSGVNPSIIRAFVEGAFAGQETLNIRIRDLIGDGVENKYPLLALPKFQKVLDLSFDIDKESIAPYLDKLCPAKPSKSKPKPSADVDKEDIDSSRE